MSKFVVIIFPDEKEAYEGLRAITTRSYLVKAAEGRSIFQKTAEQRGNSSHGIWRVVKVAPQA